MADSPPPPPTPDDLRVAEILQQVRSGVRQRRAETATLAGSEKTRGGLLELKTREYVREPVPLSHRPRLGRLIVLARKAFFKLFLKWFLRPVIEQQNAYNQAASRLIEELVEAQERTARELRQVSARLEAPEQRLGEQDGSGEGRA